jgi:hypothetical protein
VLSWQKVSVTLIHHNDRRSQRFALSFRYTDTQTTPIPKAIRTNAFFRKLDQDSCHEHISADALYTGRKSIGETSHYTQIPFGSET